MFKKPFKTVSVRFAPTLPNHLGLFEEKCFYLVLLYRLKILPYPGIFICDQNSRVFVQLGSEFSVRLFAKICIEMMKKAVYSVPKAPF